MLRLRLEAKPLFVGRITIFANRATIVTHASTFHVVAPRKCLRDLFDLVDGTISTARVLDRLSGGWDRRCLLGLINHLFDAGVLVESNKAIAAHWACVQHPPTSGSEGGVSGEPDAVALVNTIALEATAQKAALYGRALPIRLGKLLEQRGSARGFKPGALPRRSVIAILCASYAFQRTRSGPHRTVPSAGALSGLAFFLHLVTPVRGSAAGSYRVHFRLNGTIGLIPIAGASWSFACFGDPDALRFAQAVVVIAADFPRCAGKYGNRALLYLCLEAGHALQNAALAAGELDVGVLEIGAFEEEKLRRALVMPDGFIPIATLAVGNADSSAGLVDAPPFFGQWVDSGDPQYPLPFYLRMVHPIDPLSDIETCWGRDKDPFVAHDKALAEAFERLAVCRPAGLCNARFHDLPDAVDPRQVVQYLHDKSPNGLRRPFRFEPSTDWWWKEGHDHWSGARVWIAADQVYYGAELDNVMSGKPYYRATTSGVACFPTAHGALERAVLELLERDAFMRAWLSRVRLPDVVASQLSPEQRERLGALHEAGYRVAVKQLQSAYAQCALVFCQSEKRASTVIGTAAAYSMETAVDQAMTEVEAIVWVAARSRSESTNDLQPERVRSPENHRDLYRCRKYFRRADWLGEPRPTGGPERRLMTATNWASLQSRLFAAQLRLLTVDLTPPGAALHRGRCPLHVVRAIIPGLLPLTFGYGEEPALPRLSGQGRKAGVQVAFPHPFG